MNDTQELTWDSLSQKIKQSAIDKKSPVRNNKKISKTANDAS